MPLTGDVSVVSQGVLDLLDANKNTLNIAVVYFGDQNLLAKTPAACVIPGTKQRVLANTGFSTDVFLSVHIMLYHGKVQDVQDNLKECIESAERVEALLHANKQLGGLVVNGFVETAEPGFARRNKQVLRATRITWQGRSKTII